MDFIRQWLVSNLEFVFFIYGVTYIAMGVAILVQPKKGSSFKIANILWLVVAYALIHAPADFIHMWSILKGRNEILFIISHVLIICSFFFLFEFGRRIFKILKPDSLLFNNFVLPVILLVIVIISFFAQDFWVSVKTLVGYLVRIPGGIMAGLGIITYYKYEKETLKSIKVKPYFMWCGYTLLAWTFFFIIIRTKGIFFPSTQINIEIFFMAIKIPAFILRSFCGIIVAWSFSGILSIFNWETKWKIQNALNSEKESRNYLDNIISNMSDSLFVTDKNGTIKTINPAALNLLKHTKDDVIGKSIDTFFTHRNIIANYDFSDLSTSKSAVSKESRLQKSNGNTVPVIFSYSTIIKDESHDEIEFVGIAKDITELKQMENALRVANDELNIKVKIRTTELERTCNELEIEILRRKKAEETLISSYSFLQTIIDGVADPIMVINNNYQINLMNKTAINNFLDGEFDSSLFCYKVLHNRNSPCGDSDHSCLLEKVRKTRHPIMTGHKHYQANGEVRYVEILASPLINEDGLFQGIIEIMRDITERKRLEKEIINISEMERQRIGQDLHDDLAQNLVAIDVLCKMLQKKLSDKTQPEAGDAAEIARFVTQAIGQTRKLARGLCPVSLEPEGFISAIEKMISEVENVFKIKCKITANKNIIINDSFAAIHLYHILREAVNNIVKHANAENITIEIINDNNNIVLIIMDDGIGIPQHLNNQAGLGLRIMNYRANIIGADLNINRNEDRGTVVTCNFNTIENRFKIGEV